MATIKTITYSGNTAIALDLSSLATSASFVAGMESDQVDNTTNQYVDALVDVKGIIGHASTAPVVGQEIRLHIWGSDVSLATTPIDVLDGTTSAETLDHVSVLNALRLVGAAEVTVATAAKTYWFQPFSVRSFFGGVMPKFWGLFVSHNHAGALGASNNSKFAFTGIRFTDT